MELSRCVPRNRCSRSWQPGVDKVVVLHEPAVTFTFAQVVSSMSAIAGSSGTFLFQFQQIEEVTEGELQIFLQLWLGNASGIGK